MMCAAVCKFFGGDASTIIAHPVVLALNEAAMIGFNGDFVHMMVKNINQLQHNKGDTGLVPLEIRYKLHLCALIACCHSVSHKNGSGVNIVN